MLFKYTAAGLCLWAASLAVGNQQDNLSKQFDAIHDRGEIPADYEMVLDRLRSYKFLLVPGYGTDMVRQGESSFGIQVYFSPQIETFESLGIDYAIVQTKSGQLIDENGTTILEEIKKSKKPVILWGHSKGGVEVIHAALRMRPQHNRSMLSGMIIGQSPVYGTPVASSDISSGAEQGRPLSRLRGPLQLIIQKIIAEFFGDADGEALAELSPEARTEYWTPQREKDLKTLLMQVPVLSVVSAKTNEPGLDTPFELIRNDMDRRGIPNDGMIPTDSMWLDGSSYVELKNVDHVGLYTQRLRPDNFEEKRATSAILYLMGRML